ncbi:MAG: AsnC family transcriptional regulator [Syntrophomonadaceae bacterium]|nr:AsnC family transcriptional regulator [Syntrophomonadaceae bacterium]
MIDLSALDKEVLNRVQKNFPLTTTPYADIAAAMGVSETDVMESIRKMKSAGIIRRIGGIFDTPRMGYHSTLCAMQVPADRIETVAAIVNQQNGVTHNYLRENPVFNLWFTVTAPSKMQLNEILVRLEQESGLAVSSMPAKKIYKIKVFFEMGDK